MIDFSAQFAAVSGRVFQQQLIESQLNGVCAPMVSGKSGASHPPPLLRLFSSSVAVDFVSRRQFNSTEVEESIADEFLDVAIRFQSAFRFTPRTASFLGIGRLIASLRAADLRCRLLAPFICFFLFFFCFLVFSCSVCVLTRRK